MSKSTYDSLYRFFLSRGQYDKIDPKWVLSNADIVVEAGYAAQMHFFPRLTIEQDKLADDELAYLKATCGRGVE